MSSLATNPSTVRVSLVLVALAVAFAAASWFLGVRQGSPTAGNLDRYLANSLDRTGARTDRIINELQSRLRVAPDDWAAYSELGVAYLQKARETGDPTLYNKAEDALQRALNAQPDDYTALAAMGMLDLARHNFSSALEWGERARMLNPSRTIAYGVIGDAQVELGRYSEAEQTLQTMVDLRPDASSYARISYLRELHGDTDGAIAMMQRAVDANGGNTESAAWTRTQVGNLYFNAGRFDAAAREYERTLQITPDYVYALAGLARVRSAQGRDDQALALVTQATETIPLPEFLILRGELAQRMGNAQEAQRQYDTIRAIEKLYRANGVNIDAEIALFNADHQINLPETVSLARAEYTRRPSIYTADVLAWALFQVGKDEEAARYSKEALRLGTNDALKWFHAGMIYARLGDRTRARAALERALDINPHFSILYERMARDALQELQAVSR